MLNVHVYVINTVLAHLSELQKQPPDDIAGSFRCQEQHLKKIYRPLLSSSVPTILKYN